MSRTVSLGGLNIRVTIIKIMTVFIQYGTSLDRLIREVVIETPDLLPVYILKEDVSDGF